MRDLLHPKRVPWFMAVLVTAVLTSSAQQPPTPQPDDLQKQLEQLKQQYDTTTRDMEQRIAALEQQIQKQKETSEKAKEGTVTAVELARASGAEGCQRRVRSSRSKISRPIAFGADL